MKTKPKDIPITIIYNEKEAIMHAYNNAKTGSLITIMCDVVAEALDLIKALKEKKMQRNWPWDNSPTCIYSYLGPCFWQGPFI